MGTRSRSGSLVWVDDSDGVFYDFFELDEDDDASFLGEGSFSQVFSGIHKDTGKEYAIKCIDRLEMPEPFNDLLLGEVSILRELSELNEPKIMSCYGFFTEEDTYYLITEKIDGGELLERVMEKEMGYRENDARDCIQMILQAIVFIHGHNIVHRDLKPENILLVSDSDDVTIKLADFGFACRYPESSPRLTQIFGTPGYCAPEILEGVPYEGPPVDIYSAGLISYLLLCGVSPYETGDAFTTRMKNKKGVYDFSHENWAGVSDEAKDLVATMLNLDPSKRPSALQLLSHPWFSEDEEQLVTRDLQATVDTLKDQFNARRAFEAAISSVSREMERERYQRFKRRRRASVIRYKEVEEAVTRYTKRRDNEGLDVDGSEHCGSQPSMGPNSAFSSMASMRSRRGRTASAPAHTLSALLAAAHLAETAGGGVGGGAPPKPVKNNGWIRKVLDEAERVEFERSASKGKELEEQSEEHRMTGTSDLSEEYSMWSAGLKLSEARETAMNLAWLDLKSPLVPTASWLKGGNSGCTSPSAAAVGEATATVAGDRRGGTRSADISPRRIGGGSSEPKEMILADGDGGHTETVQRSINHEKSVNQDGKKTKPTIWGLMKMRTSSFHKWSRRSGGSLGLEDEQEETVL